MPLINTSYQFCVITVIISYLALCVHSDIPRPRGVSLSKASLYTPSKDFTCFDGTVTIPFSYVNDDYCDCFDGSDEPGTSACLNGVFHCTNAGHKSLNIPSSKVNDGVCDCCDGEDEYSRPELCSNICDEMGKEARAEAERMAELLTLGNQIRLQLIELGNIKKQEMADQLNKLEKDRAEAEQIKQEKQDLKDEIEAKENEALKVYRDAEEKERLRKLEEEEQANKKEATEHFNRFDSDSDGYLTVTEIQTRNVFDKDKNGEVSIEEAKYFLAENENIDLDTFIQSSWPLLKPSIMMEKGLFTPPSEENTDSEKIDLDKTDIDDEQEDDDEPSEHEHENEMDADDLEDIPDDPSHDIDQPDVDSRKYDDTTQQLVDEATEARQQLTDAERHVREIESNIRNIKENLNKNYGLNQEYASFDGECFEYEDKEYVYRLCMFQKATQKSKNGGSEIGLGNWGEWVDVNGNSYGAMKYTNGIACWNGPNRMTTVNLNCGLETKLTSVSEPFRCEYKFELSTPAACDDSKIVEHQHDEL